MANAYGSVASAASFTCTKPTGTASGDVLTAAVFSIGSANGATSSGWTQQKVQSLSSTYTLTILTKAAGGSEPANYTFATTSGIAGATVIVRTTGSNTTTVIDGTATSSNTATAASITTTSANSILIMATVGFNDLTGTSIVPNAGMTEVAELVEANVTYGSLEVAYEVRGSAGASGTRTSTDASASGFLTAMVAIKEASSSTNHPLVGTSSGIGNQTGALIRALSLAGTSSGIGASTGALSVTRSVAGTSGGVGDQTGNLTLTRVVYILGTSDGIGDQTGDLHVRWSLAGTSTGIGDQSASLSFAISIAGTSSGIGDQTGDLFVGTLLPTLPWDPRLGQGTYTSGQGITGSVAKPAVITGSVASTTRHITGEVS